MSSLRRQMLLLRSSQGLSRQFLSQSHGRPCCRKTVPWRSRAWRWCSDQDQEWVSSLFTLCLYVINREKSNFSLSSFLSASGTEPMCWSSFMTSSMQLAKECLSQKLTDDMGESFQPFEGLEKFAETIETGMLCLYCRANLKMFVRLVFCQILTLNCLSCSFEEGESDIFGYCSPS